MPSAMVDAMNPGALLGLVAGAGGQPAAPVQAPAAKPNPGPAKAG